jgi:transmembrane sensor
VSRALVGVEEMSDAKIKNPQIAEEAADWAVTLDAGDLSSDQQLKLADWLLESPRHVEELLIAATLLDALDGVDADKSRSVNALISSLPSEVVSIVRDGQQADRENAEALNGIQAPRLPWLQWVGVGAAASMALAIIGFAVAPQFAAHSIDDVQIADASNDGSSGFTTKLGEQRKMTLEDGSIIHVNTQSEVVIRYEDHQRVVELLRGEALFEVAHNPDRPFRVIAGDTIAEAIGTTFNVYRTSDQTTVAVIDGKVAVMTEEDFVNTAVEDEVALDDIGQTDDGRLLLAAGQKADITPQEKTVRVAAANVKAVASWRVGQLIFEGDSLAEIAKQFNRYNRTRIVIADDRLASTEFSGVFDADDPESLIEFLELADSIRVDRHGSGVIKLSPR